MDQFDKLKVYMHYTINGLYLNAICGKPLLPITYHHSFEDFIDDTKQDTSKPDNLSGWMARYKELTWKRN